MSDRRYSDGGVRPDDALLRALNAIHEDALSSKDDPPTNWVYVAACALTSIAGSAREVAVCVAELVELDRARFEMMAAEYGEMFPDRPIVDTKPL